MTLPEKILSHVEKLPQSYQAEVLDFIQFLEIKTAQPRRDEASEAWSRFSLAQAFRGMDDEEDLYSLEDLQETT